MNISEAIRKRILYLCDENDITVNALSDKSGITQSTLNDIVNGTTYSTGVATIQKMCDGLDISIRDFFDSELFSDIEQEVK